MGSFAMVYPSGHGKDGDVTAGLALSGWPCRSVPDDDEWPKVTLNSYSAVAAGYSARKRMIKDLTSSATDHCTALLLSNQGSLLDGTQRDWDGSQSRSLTQKLCHVFLRCSPLKCHCLGPRAQEYLAHQRQ